MSTRFSVRLTSEIANHPLPPSIVLMQHPLESPSHVLLKLLAFVVLYRERLEIEPHLHDDNIPFVPDLLQLDYEMKPALWIECGETPVTKLDKLAVKVPAAEIWVVRESVESLDTQAQEMARGGLRKSRYRMLGFESDLFEEMLGLLTIRNDLTLFLLDMSADQIQLDFNGVWFETVLAVRSF